MKYPINETEWACDGICSTCSEKQRDDCGTDINGKDVANQTETAIWERAIDRTEGA